MNKYELLFILPGTLDENEAAVQAEEILVALKPLSESAELKKMGKIRLAYPIKQIRYGYFFNIIFSADKQNVKTVEEKLRLSRNVLRVMLTHFNEAAVDSQKIVYNTSPTGITTMVDRVMEKSGTDENKKVDMEDINKRLDEILEGNIIPQI